MLTHTLHTLSTPERCRTPLIDSRSESLLHAPPESDTLSLSLSFSFRSPSPSLPLSLWSPFLFSILWAQVDHTPSMRDPPPVPSSVPRHPPLLSLWSPFLFSILWAQVDHPRSSLIRQLPLSLPLVTFSLFYSMGTSGPPSLFPHQATAPLRVAPYGTGHRRFHQTCTNASRGGTWGDLGGGRHLSPQSPSLPSVEGSKEYLLT